MTIVPTQQYGDHVERDAYSLVLEAIHEHWKLYRCPPSYRWIGRAIVPPGEKPRSNAVVNYAIDRLVRDGHIVKETSSESSYPAIVPVEVAGAIAILYTFAPIKVPPHAPRVYSAPITEKAVRDWVKENMVGYATYKTTGGIKGVICGKDPQTCIDGETWRDVAVKIGMPC